MADRQYELVYILPPDATEAQVAEVQTQIEEVVSRLHGQIASTDNWGASVSPTRSRATRRATTSSRRSTAAAS